MTTDRRLVSAALGLALLVAACGGSSSASPAASAAASQAAAASPAAAATSSPTDVPASSDTSGSQSPDASMPDFSLSPGNASDLEAMIPDKVGDTTITKTSMDYGSIPWASLAGSGSAGSDSIDKVLKGNGKTLADIRFAMGVGTSTGGAAFPTMVYAIQVKGLDATKFVTAVDSGYDTATSISMGSKTVKGSIDSGMGSVTYVHNDVVFIIIGSEANIKAIVDALP